LLATTALDGQQWRASRPGWGIGGLIAVEGKKFHPSMELNPDSSMIRQ
jgi:hypothetical protein